MKVVGWSVEDVECPLPPSCLGRIPAPLCTSVLAWPTSDAKVCHSLVYARFAALGGAGCWLESEGESKMFGAIGGPRPSAYGPEQRQWKVG